MGGSSSKSIDFVDLIVKCGGDGISFSEEILNVNGKRRNVASWFPESTQPTAVVFVVHGLSEHSLCYYAVAHALNRSGFCVYAMDHVSHGKSDGERDVIRNHKDLYEDLASFMNEKRKEHPDIPAFIISHSMGTLATIMAINRLQGITAVVFSGPALFAGPAASSPFGMRCLYPLSQTSAAVCLTSCTSAVDPRGLAAPLDVSAITSDPDELEDMRRDPRRNKPLVTNKTAKELISLIAACKREVPRITLPFLCIHGEADQIALKSGSEFIHKYAGTELAQRRIKIFPGLKHECFHEVRPYGAESIELVVNYLKEFLTTEVANVNTI